MLESASEPYEVTFCGPDEDVALAPATLARASIYAQPGGGELKSAWTEMEQYAEPIRDWVRTGGHYLGFCLGGYLAGATPGFGLLPGDTARYISSRGSSVDTTDNTIVEVSWRGEERSMFFQDGPIFVLNDNAQVEVLARYRNGKIAALVTDFGSGRVGVVGPHPEADKSWYKRGLTNPDGIRFDLGQDLIDTVTGVSQQQLWIPSP